MRTTIAHTYLFDLQLPEGGIDALLDTTDSLWYCLERYCRERNLVSLQLLSVAAETGITTKIVRTRSGLPWAFIPNRPWWKAKEFARLLPNLAIVQINHISLGNILSVIIGRLAGAKVILAFLNDYDFSQYTVPLWILKIAVDRFADCILTTTELNRRRLAGAMSAPIVILNHGVDTNLFKPLVSVKPGNGQLQVVYIGRITPDKNIEDIVRGVKLAKHKSKINVTFVGQLYGTSNAYLNELRRTLREAGITHEFPGYLTHPELPNMLADKDVFVNMRKQEGFGKVFIEAMACGKPVIGRRGSAGPEEIIQDGENGFLVEGPEELARRLDYLVEDVTARQRLGQQARRDVEGKYSFGTIYGEFCRIYDRLLYRNIRETAAERSI
jgi:glycosyltransferase involved in cell wall biosynthesis